MAEVAAILGMANAGFKLSITLFAFAEAVRTVDKEILRTAKDISLFSSVLKLLAETVERGHQSKRISPKAYETTAQIVEECKSLFDELDDVIARSTTKTKTVRMGQDDMVAKDAEKVIVPLVSKSDGQRAAMNHVAATWAQRLLYFFRKGKMEVHRRNLESLKTSLQVMLSVLNFAEKVTTESKSGSQPNPELHEILLAQERLEMESLILANEAAATEVRKHSKDEQKEFKVWPSKLGKPGRDDSLLEVSKPSITSTGIVYELAKDNPSQSTNTADANAQAPSQLPADSTSDMYLIMQSLPSVPVVFRSLEPKIDESKEKVEASTQDRAPVINQLLALWSPEASTALSIDRPAGSAQKSKDPQKTNGMVDAHYRHRKSKAQMADAQKPMDKPVELPAEEPEEEVVNLFLSRSRPY